MERSEQEREEAYETLKSLSNPLEAVVFLIERGWSKEDICQTIRTQAGNPLNPSYVDKVAELMKQEEEEDI